LSADLNLDLRRGRRLGSSIGALRTSHCGVSHRAIDGSL
jgi:hypothetical protein